jgi:uncharacterized protein
VAEPAVQHEDRAAGYLAPAVDPDSQPWWDALAEERLILPHCLNCGRLWFPPSPGCPNCGAVNWEWVDASGRGTIYSWVVIARALHPAFAGDVPYTIVAVDLEEGARIFGRLAEGVEPAPGAPVRAEVYHVGGHRVLGFAAG